MTVRYSLFHKLNQALASTRPAAWLFARTMHHLDRFLLKLSGNRITGTGVLTGLPMVMVHTVGAKSGKPRHIPLLAIPEQGSARMALIGSNFGQKHHPAWYFNLKAHPRVMCTLRGESRPFVAHEAQGEEYDRFWSAAADVYFGYPLYKSRVGNRHIPIMVLEPDGDGGSSR